MGVRGGMNVYIHVYREGAQLCDLISKYLKYMRVCLIASANDVCFRRKYKQMISLSPAIKNSSTNSYQNSLWGLTLPKYIYIALHIHIYIYIYIYSPPAVGPEVLLWNLILSSKNIIVGGAEPHPVDCAAEW